MPDADDLTPHRFAGAGTAPETSRRGRILVVGLLLAVASACGDAGTSSDPPATTTPAAPTPGGTLGGTTGTTGAATVQLVDFSDPEVGDRWVTVNDPVMGGRSTSQLTPGTEGLVFSGVLSLENNGGFASLRSPEDPDLGRQAAGADAIRVRAAGDGNTYVLQIRGTDQQWSYIQRFTTGRGGTESYELPVDGFEAVDFFLEPAPQAPPQLDPSTISQLAVYILDKQEGPFELTLVDISAVP